jgi:hypothetical protein
MHSTTIVASVIAIAGAILGLALAFWWRSSRFIRRAIPDEVVPELTIRDNPDGTFAVIDATQGVRVAEKDFTMRGEAERFIEGYDLKQDVWSPAGAQEP